MFSSDQHLRFDLCRQVQVPLLGKLTVLEIRAAECYLHKQILSSLTWEIPWSLCG